MLRGLESLYGAFDENCFEKDTRAIISTVNSISKLDSLFHIHTHTHTHTSVRTVVDSMLSYCICLLFTLNVMTEWMGRILVSESKWNTGENISDALCAGQLTVCVVTFIFIYFLNLSWFHEAIWREMSPMICGDFDGVWSKVWVKATVKNVRHNQSIPCTSKTRINVENTQTLSWFRFLIFHIFIFLRLKWKNQKTIKRFSCWIILQGPQEKRWIFLVEHNEGVLGRRGRDPRIPNPGTWWRWVVGFTNRPFKLRGKFLVRRQGETSGKCTVLKIWATSSRSARSVNVFYSYVVN